MSFLKFGEREKKKKKKKKAKFNLIFKYEPKTKGF
jgi:hypothetical protein